MIVGFAGFENNRTPSWLAVAGNPPYVAGRFPNTLARRVSNNYSAVFYQNGPSFNAADYYIAFSYYVKWASGNARIFALSPINLNGNNAPWYADVGRTAGSTLSLVPNGGSGITLGTLSSDLPEWTPVRVSIQRVGGGDVIFTCEINGQLMVSTIPTTGSNNAGPSTIGFNAGGGVAWWDSQIDIDDLVVQDATGSIDNSGLAPLIRVTPANPAAAGTLNDFSITGGAPDKQTALAAADTQYLTSAAANATQTMTMPGAPNGVAGCLGANIWTRARKGLGSPYTMGAGLLIDGTPTVATPSLPLAADFAEYQRSVNYKTNNTRITMADAASMELLIKNNS